MARRRFVLLLTSLRARLVMLVVLALLPAMIFVTQLYREQRASAVDRLDGQALRTLGLVATQGTDVFDAARRTMTALAHTARLTADHLPAIDHAAMNAVMQAVPSIVTLTITDSAGLVVNQALTPSSGARAEWDPTLARRAMFERGFTVGHYQADRARHRSLVTCATPILGPRGENWGAVTVILSEQWLTELLERSPLVEGAALLLTDEQGTVIVRAPNGAQWTGRSVEGTKLHQAMRADDHTVVASDGIDKVQRRYVFATFGTGGTRVHVAYGIPVDTVLANERAARTRNIVVLVVLVLATALAAWFWGSALIVAPVRDISRVARSLRAGDFAVRAGIHGRGELGQLSRLIDDMATHVEQSIGERDAMVTERDGVVAALRRSEEHFRLLVDAVRDYAICMLDPSGLVVSWNAGATRITGFSSEESIGQPFSRIFPQPEVARGLPDATLARAAEEGSLTLEGWRCRKDGTQFFAHDVFTAVCAADGELTGFSLITQDITALRAASQARDAAEAKLRAANETLEHSVAELEGHVHEIGLLNELSDRLQASNDVAEVAAATTRTCSALFAGSSGTLYQLDASHRTAAVAASWGGYPDVSMLADDCWALRGGTHSFYIEGKNALPPCPHAETHGYARTMCVRLAAREEVLGVLHIAFPAVAAGNKREESRRIQADMRLAEAVSKQVGLALANIRLKDSLRGQALRDPLTDLFNRRYMEETLEREVSRSLRKGTPLAVIMLDLDNFKSYNDEHGHQAGDSVLREVATFLQAHVRGEDVACRYGGEEFTLILPGASRQAAEQRARQILRGLRQLPVRSGAQMLPSVTASLGVAVFPDNGVSASVLVQAADAALYQAKSAGRDCVALATPGGSHVA